jgi:hypothetical protein
MSVTESGITLNFPDNNYFRFENCQGYKNIQDNFKEMDVCWYDQISDTLYLIELKDWKSGKLSEEDDPSIPPQKLKDIREGISKSNIRILVKKSVDSASMFMSVLLQKPYAANIQSCYQFAITNKTQIKLLSIINWTNTDITYISNINTAYKSKFHPYAKLFDISVYLVLTKEQAMKKFDWIS